MKSPTKVRDGPCFIKAFLSRQLGKFKKEKTQPGRWLSKCLLCRIPRTYRNTHLPIILAFEGRDWTARAGQLVRLAGSVSSGFDGETAFLRE